MLKNFKKMIFRTTAIAASGLCLGAFFLSPLNASGPENVEEICNQAYTSLEQLKKACNFKIGDLPEYNAKSNSLGEYGECYDFVPIPQARIDFASPMKVNGNDKNHDVRVVRMLAFDKNDKDAGSLDDIKDLLADKNKLFEEYDLNSTKDKIDVSINVYDFSKHDNSLSNVIKAKMRKIPRTINGHKFVEFAIERPANCNLTPDEVPIGMIRIVKNDGSEECISEVRFPGAGALKTESDMFIKGIINFNNGTVYKG